MGLKYLTGERDHSGRSSFDISRSGEQLAVGQWRRGMKSRCEEGVLRRYHPSLAQARFQMFGQPMVAVVG